MSKTNKDHREFSDNDIVEGFKSGRKELFDLIVERYAAKLYQVAYGILNNKQDAEEVVQDCFVRAYKSLDDFRGDSGLETWLHRITMNLSRNKYHWNRRRGAAINVSISGQETNRIGETDIEDMEIPDCLSAPDLILENEELEKRISEGFEQLPETLKETMVLRHVKDMPYEKIAELLECKIGTIKSRLARGREFLWNFVYGKD